MSFDKGRHAHHSESDISLPIDSNANSISLASRLLYSFIFALAVTLFYVLCIQPMNSDDDYSIAFFLSGVIPHMGMSLFVNASLSHIINALYLSCPSVCWYFVVEYLSAFLAFWALSFASISFLQKGSGLIAVGFCACFVMPYCIASSNYTVVAGFCAAVGMLYLVSYAYLEKPSPVIGVVGVLLFVLGMLWRSQMFLAALPFAFIAAVWHLIEARLYQDSSRHPLASFWPLLVACILCVAFYGYNAHAWQQDGWREWLEYNESRTVLSDQPKPSYDEAQSELESLGISRNDYLMLTTWANADTDSFPTELISKVAELKLPLSMDVESIANAASSYGKGIMGRWQYFGPILLCLILLSLRRWQRILPIVGCFAISFAMCTYFLLRDRLLYRVEVPVWCYFLFTMLALSPQSKDASTQTAAQNSLQAYLPKVKVALGILVVLASCAVSAKKYVSWIDWANPRLLLTQDSYQPTGRISRYLSGHPETFYIMSSEQHVQWEQEYRNLYIPSESDSLRVMPLGGWGVGSPCRYYQASLLGVGNAVATLIADEPSQLIARESIAKQVETLLQEHYDSSVRCEKVESLEGDESISVWRYVRSEG